jgi:S1-C subfamily serine protease
MIRKAFLATLFLFTTTVAAYPSLKPPEANVMRSVVFVAAENASGSGVIVKTKKAKKGYIATVVTNYHVIAKLCNTRGPKMTCKQPTIYLYGKKVDVNSSEEAKGTIIKYDSNKDLAMITVPVLYKPVSAIMTNATLDMFEQVWAIGAGLGLPPFPTVGMISIPDLNGDIVHSAMIISGNSGGGLFIYNRKKHRYELVGINFAIALKPEKLGEVPITHIAFAIPIPTLKKFLG